ncbi:LysR family transcriptional regulator [Kiloniella sp. b19]|uniref:LysR family transcriptional regulator n=1 Tax=Kiloniella sp. GXU_MW_B19 TaxID=3141326 RepID=UPI0031E0D7DC
MINSVHLRTFKALVEERSFTGAARRLHMTQPGVSQHVRKLESDLETPLLSRFGKQFELTPAGEKLFVFACEREENEQSLIERIVSDDPFSGDCRLACSGAQALELYPRLLELQRSYPGLSVRLEAAPVKRILKLVSSRELDVGIVSGVEEYDGVDFQEAGREELCLIVPKSFEGEWEDLLELGFINHPDGRRFGQEVLQQLFPDHFQSLQQIRESGFVNQIHQILLPVALGLGFTVLQRSAYESFEARPELRILFPERAVQKPLYLVKRAGRQLPARFDLLTSVLGGNPGSVSSSG